MSLDRVTMVGVVAEQEVAQRTMGKKDGDQHGIEGDGIEGAERSTPWGMKLFTRQDLKMSDCFDPKEQNFLTVSCRCAADSYQGKCLN